MKISAKVKDCRLLVKAKTTGGEVIDEKELARFARAYMRCFLKPHQMKGNVVELVGPTGIPLKDRLRRPITKREFLFILEHIVVAIQKLNSGKFPICNLKMDMQYIYINEATKELQFLYIPMAKAVPGTNIIDLLNMVIASSHPVQERDMAYVARFNAFFRMLRPFDINKIEQFVQKEDPTVVSTVRKHNAGQSGFMTSDHKRYYDHLDEQKRKAEEATALLADEEATGLLVENTPVFAQPEEEATGLLVEETPVFAQPEEEATGLLVEETPVFTEPEEATGLLVEETPVFAQPEEEATGLLVEETPVFAQPEEEATGLLVEDEEEGTTLLAETVRTGPAVQPKPAVAYPELHRVLTGEVIQINKPVFRLGKERSYVDYFVTNNSAVSRSHADIITREFGYFVIDLNSKNRTYINNVPLVVQQETRICDGDTLRLGNEEFTFHAAAKAAAPRFCPRCRAQVKETSNFCAYCGCRL